MSRRRPNGVLAALACLMLAACAAPAVRPPSASLLPAAASAQGGFTGQSVATVDQPPPGAWWRLYNDPVLDGLISEALAANRDLRQAAAALARAQAIVTETALQQQPSTGLGAGVSAGHASAAANGLATPLETRLSYDAGIGVSYQLDLYGKLQRATEAARADADSLAAAYDLARITIANQTAQAYAGHCGAGYRLAVARRVRDLQQQSLALTQRLQARGRAVATDVVRARTQLALVEATLPPLEAQQRASLFALAALTGRTGIGTLPPQVLGCHQLPALRAPLPTGDIAGLIKRRPDIRAAERALTAADARIGMADADLYPSISLGLTAGSTAPLSSALADTSFRWSLGPLLSWTFPDRRRARSRITQAEAGAEAALARFDATVLRALQETETALAVYARERDRNVALRRALDGSRQAFEQTRRLYEAGRSGYLPVLDAERTLADTQAQLALSDTQLVSDQLALFLALGGGWDTGPTSARRE